MYTDQEIKIFKILKCDLCREKEMSKSEKKENCKLCYKKGNMMKKYKNFKQHKGWVDLKCVKWFMNNIKIEEENGFIIFVESNQISSDIYIENCSKCGKSDTFIVKCSGKCGLILHPDCIEKSWIYEENNFSRPKFRFLQFRCDICQTKVQSKKGNSKLSEVKTYGKDLNSKGGSLSNIKIAELRNFTDCNIILNTHKPVIIHEGTENNLKFKMEFMSEVEGDNSLKYTMKSNIKDTICNKQLDIKKKFIGKKHQKEEQNDKFTIKSIFFNDENSSDENEQIVSTSIKCDICIQGLDVKTELTLRRCENCFTSCHISCAKEVGEKESNICKKCLIDRDLNIGCLACEKKFGSMLKCDSGWIHIICALMMKKYFYKKPDQLYALGLNSSNNKSKIKKKCCVCRIINYYTVDCNNCNISFHPYCGFIANFELVMIDNKCGSYVLGNELNCLCFNHQMYKIRKKEDYPNESRSIEIAKKNIKGNINIKSKSRENLYESELTINRKLKKKYLTAKQIKYKKSLTTKINFINKNDGCMRNIRKLRTRQENMLEIDSLNYNKLKILILEKFKIDPFLLLKQKSWSWELTDTYFLPLVASDLSCINFILKSDLHEDFDKEELQNTIDNIVYNEDFLPAPDKDQIKHLKNILCLFRKDKKEYLCIYDISKIQEMKLLPDFKAYYSELLNLPINPSYSLKSKRIFSNNIKIEGNSMFQNNIMNKNMKIIDDEVLSNNEDQIKNDIINKFNLSCDYLEDYLIDTNPQLISNQQLSNDKTNLINKETEIITDVNGKLDMYRENIKNQNPVASNKFIKKFKLLKIFRLRKIDKKILKQERIASEIVKEKLKIKNILLNDIDYEILVKTEMLKFILSKNSQMIKCLNNLIQSEISSTEYLINNDAQLIISTFKSVSKYGYIKRRLKKGLEDKTIEEIIKNRGQNFKLGKTISRDKDEFKMYKREIYDNLSNSESECCVCFYSDGDDHTPIVFCDSCNVSVHQECYGIKEIPEGNYYCDLCDFNRSRDKMQSKVSNTIKLNFQECCLCGTTKGAMKRLDKTGDYWAHVTCILFSDSIKFTNYDNMKEIKGFKTSQNNINNICNICRRTLGDLFPCSKCQIKLDSSKFDNLPLHFHFFCAYLNGLKLEIKEEFNILDKYHTKIIPLIECIHCMNINKNIKNSSNQQKELRLMTYHKQLSEDHSDKKIIEDGNSTSNCSKIQENEIEDIKSKSLHDRQAVINYYVQFENNNNSMDVDYPIRLSLTNQFNIECNICFEYIPDELISQCSNCMNSFHNKCYVIERLIISKIKILCQYCKYIKKNINERKYANCLLCSNKGGIVRKCVTNILDKKLNLNWVHVICANYTEEMFYNYNKNQFEGFDLIEINKLCILKCEICRSNRGSVIKCCINECYNKFHAYCAVLNGLDKDLSIKNSDQTKNNKCNVS